MARIRPLFCPRLECLEDRSVPATFNVTTSLDVIDPADGKRSLREAITAANTFAGADVIALPTGVYKLALAGAGEDANATGDFDITGAVTIRGAGAGLTIIDGQQLDRVFDVAGTAPNSIKVVLEKMTIRNGLVTGNGGGVEFADADLVVRDATVSGNRASQRGGGISSGTILPTGNVTLVRSTVSRNVASGAGGGLFVFSQGSVLTVSSSTVRRNIAGNNGGGINAVTATLTNCTVSGNSCADDGGGLSVSTATLTNSTISGNSAGIDGGGINATTATLTNCTVSGNSAFSNGGGINASIATLTNSTVSDNSAGNGGGGVLGTTATLTNCTISVNSAGTTGGGIHADTATLLNCTIVENSALTGGGLFHNLGGNFTLRNTIVALNMFSPAGSDADVSGSFTSSSNNLIGDGAGGSGLNNGVNGNITGTSANPIDPKLGPLKNNGGKTKTHALLAGSRAIDRGDNSILPPTDQRGAGFPRKKDGNFNGVAIVDIGAFER